MSDNVYFINPSSSNYKKEFDAFSSAWGWDKPVAEDDRVAFVSSLINKGLDENEAEAYFSGEQKIGEYMSYKNKASIVKAPCTLISFGTK